MTGRPSARDNSAASRLHAVAAGLSAAGLSAAGMAVSLRPALAGQELAAVAEGRAERKIEVVVDESGAAAIRSLISPDATASQIVGAITGAVDALSPVIAPTNPRTHPPAQRRSSGPVAGYDDAVTDCAGDAHMPGPEDRLIDQEPSQGQPRPGPVDHGHQTASPREQDQRESYPPLESDTWREAPPPVSELHERLERLPLGHPSSPYNSDGSRKPPPPDLTKYELPLPDEPGWQPQAIIDDAPRSDAEPDEALRAEEGASLRGPQLRAEPLIDAESADCAHPVGDRLQQERAEGLATAQSHPVDADDECPSLEASPRKGDSTLDTHADQPLVSEARPVIGPDNSWEWKGRYLTCEHLRDGDQTLEEIREVEGRDADGKYGEHGLTPAMRRIEAQLECGRLIPDTEKYALKTPDRFREKLAERINLFPNEPAAKLAARIHDGIRYTFVYEDGEYTNGWQATEETISRHGYELIGRKPSWDSLDYKGTNSQWREPDSGVFFEVQFHTYASWDAKQKTHAAYERLADPRTSPEERQRLDAYQREVTASVPIPPGALGIPHYRKEDT